VRRALIGLGLCLLACRGPAPSRVGSARAQADVPREIVDDDGRSVFLDHGVDGAFVLLDERRGITTVVNPALASRGFLPASTFKIPNTLIGLETGAIPDEHLAMKWNGVVHAESEEWNRDHDLASAMKFSVVWFYQEVARRIGETRMRVQLAAFGYGNRDISGGIDLFWLQGDLRITPREQVAFLHRLHARELPVAASHAAVVERLIVLAERPDITLRGKTGVTEQGPDAIAWLVGLVERGADRYAFATLITAPKERIDQVVPLRKTLGRKLLVRHGVIPAEMAEP
jgi:beta-lactamase class D